MINCEDPIQKKCEEVCTFFVNCTLKIRKDENLSQKTLEIGKTNCLNGCGRNQTQILSCFDEAKDSCEGMKNCLMDSGLDE